MSCQNGQREGLMKRLDVIIEDYKKNSQKYESNPYRCYSLCKEEIVKMQVEGIVGSICGEYNKCIDYVTEKLNI